MGGLSSIRISDNERVGKQTFRRDRTQPDRVFGVLLWKWLAGCCWLKAGEVARPGRFGPSCQAAHDMKCLAIQDKVSGFTRGGAEIIY